MITIDQLHVSYGKFKVLKNIDLSLDRGQCVALIGPNGSGKTTLIKCILGMIIPDTGKIMLNGQPVAETDSRKHIGYMPQISRFPENMKVKDLFRLLKDLRKDQTDYDMELYESLKIESFSGRPLGVLSEGMKQKISAALAFMFKPQVLILDEPTASLDPVANEILKQKILKVVTEGKLVLISSHILSDLDEITNRVLYLLNGEIWFNESLSTLRDTTQEHQLNKIISHLLLEKEYVSNS